MDLPIPSRESLPRRAFWTTPKHGDILTKHRLLYITICHPICLVEGRKDGISSRKQDRLSLDDDVLEHARSRIPCIVATDTGRATRRSINRIYTLQLPSELPLLEGHKVIITTYVPFPSLVSRWANIHLRPSTPRAATFASVLYPFLSHLKPHTSSPPKTHKPHPPSPPLPAAST